MARSFENQVWEMLKCVTDIIEVFETCIDSGLNITDAKKIAAKWQMRKNGGVPEVFF